MYYNLIICLGMEFVIEALNFQKLKEKQCITLPQNIRSTPRQSGVKVLFHFY